MALCWCGSAGTQPPQPASNHQPQPLGFQVLHRCLQLRLTSIDTFIGLLRYTFMLMQRYEQPPGMRRNLDLQKFCATTADRV